MLKFYKKEYFNNFTIHGLADRNINFKMLLHNRKRLRLLGFNYSSQRYYFFTIVVKNHYPSFGIIKDKCVHPSANGIIAKEQWYWLGSRYPYIELTSFVIMPDHVHGIIYINNGYYKNSDVNCRDHSFQNIQKIKPLPELIGAFKTTVSKRIHMAGDLTFSWQNSYHEHIIRNMIELDRIKKYIDSNPERWNGI